MSSKKKPPAASRSEWMQCPQCEVRTPSNSGLRPSESHECGAPGAPHLTAAGVLCWPTLATDTQHATVSRDFCKLSLETMVQMEMGFGDWALLYGVGGPDGAPLPVRCLPSKSVKPGHVSLNARSARSFSGHSPSRLVPVRRPALLESVQLELSSAVAASNQVVKESLVHFLQDKLLHKHQKLCLPLYSGRLSVTVASVQTQLSIPRNLQCEFADLSIREETSDRSSFDEEPFECGVFVRDMTRLNLNSEEDAAEMKRPPTFEDIGGMSQLKLRLREEVLARFASTDESFVLGVLLHGGTGVGKSLFARAISGELGCSPQPAVLSQLVNMKSTPIANGQAVVLLEDIQFLFRKQASLSQDAPTETSNCEKLIKLFSMLRLKACNNRVLVIGVTNDIDCVDASLKRCGLFELDFEVPPPSRDDRYEILCRVVPCNFPLLLQEPAGECERTLRDVADRAHGYTPSDLVTVCNVAKSLHSRGAGSGGGGGLSAAAASESVLAALGRVKPTAMREIVLDIPQVRWHEIGGQADLKQRLRQAIEWPIKYPDRFRTFGIRPPRGVLLYGPPGCSKTMIAKALATETGLNFMSVKGPEIFDKYVGQSEKAIRKMFRRARQAAPVIIFFDEIDAIAAARGDGGSGGVGDRVLTQLLTELDGLEQLKDVVVVAATNRPDIIDKALIRPGRIDKLIYVPLPDASTRLHILQICAGKMPMAPDVDLPAIAERTEGYSGAEVCAVCDEAAMLALSDSAHHVTALHFTQSLVSVRPQTTPDVIRKYSIFSNSSIR